MVVLVAFDPCRGSGQRGSVMHVNDSGQRVNTPSKARPVWHLSMVRVTHMCALEKLEPCPDSLPGVPAPCTHWPSVARRTSSSSSKLFCPPLPLLFLQQQPQQRQPHAASASASASAVGAWDGVVSAG